jgi:hypothetical protein
MSLPKTCSSDLPPIVSGEPNPLHCPTSPRCDHYWHYDFRVDGGATATQPRRPTSRKRRTSTRRNGAATCQDAEGPNGVSALGHQGTRPGPKSAVLDGPSPPPSPATRRLRLRHCPCRVEHMRLFVLPRAARTASGSRPTSRESCVSMRGISSRMVCRLSDAECQTRGHSARIATARQ